LAPGRICFVFDAAIFPENETEEKRVGGKVCRCRRMKRGVRQFAYQGIPSRGIGASAGPARPAAARMPAGGGNLCGRAETIETKVCPLYFLPGEYDFLCTLGDMG
jgi:hypothetical protein